VSDAPRPDDPGPTLPTATRQAGGGVSGTVGPYKLLERIGEGGMGEVWLAEQTAPVRRRVALKLIKPGMDTRQVVARFESERQALALMNHPNIARVFDAGATDLGHPYFVMEHVAGEPITAHCDANRLGVRERLELLLQVCDGVRHAHQKGVIHRDLKPSNLLVTLEGGRRICKIIDFGVAKAIDQRLTERTLHTHSGTMIGTPEYMSPEQADLTALDVDTRTDVYSLGAILYELLVGVMPFDSRELRDASLDEVRRRIREDEPARPSARVTALGQGAGGTAEKRGTALPLLRRQLRGDLDWIVMKALEKDRTRRYGSPDELAADIRRFLADEPVLAGPPSALYRARKFARRHRVAVAVGATVFVTLCVGLSFALWGLVRARSAEAQARQDAAAAQAVSEFLVELFKSADPGVARGRHVTAREILDQGSRRIRSTLGEQPRLRGRLMATMGDVYKSLGLFDEAGTLIDQAIDLQSQTLGENDPETLETMLARVNLVGRRDRKEGERLARDLLDRCRRTLGPDRPICVSAMHMLGVALQRNGRLEEAEPVLREALERSDKLPAGSMQALQCRYTLAGLLLDRGEMAEAEPLYRQAIDGHKRLKGADHPGTLNALNDLGTLLFLAGRMSEAETMFAELLAAHRRVHGDDHPDTLTTLNNLGVTVALQGRLAEAEGYYLEALERRRHLLGDDDPETLFSIHNMGGLLHDQGKLDEAERYRREALERRRRVLGSEHPDTLEAMHNLARLRVDQADLDEAERLLREAVAGRKNVLGPAHADTLDSIGELGAVLDARGRDREGESLLREAIAGYRGLPQPDPRLGAQLERLGLVLSRRRAFDEAEPLLLESYDIATKNEDPGRKKAHHRAKSLARLYDAWAKPERAAEWRGKELAAR
jgi:eukaryotic-like serine/threonine-protein kinase